MLYPPLGVSTKDMNISQSSDTLLITQGEESWNIWMLILGRDSTDDPEGDADGSWDEDEGAVNLDTNTSPARGA